MTPVDARFEVLGTPFSLLSASISASQNLYTRKGTLVGFNGQAENVGWIRVAIDRDFVLIKSTPGCFHPLPARTFPSDPFRDTFYLPTRVINNAVHRLDFHQIRHYLARGCAPGRKIRLDGSATECAVSLDGTYSAAITAREQKIGKYTTSHKSVACTFD